MESATTSGSLQYLQFGKDEPLVVLPGASDSLRARTRNPGEFSFELRGLAAERGALGKIKIPALVTGGGWDDLVGVRRLRALAAAIPGTAPEIFKGAPHGLCKQRRRKFDRVALELQVS